MLQFFYFFPFLYLLVSFKYHMIYINIYIPWLIEFCIPSRLLLRRFRFLRPSSSFFSERLNYCIYIFWQLTLRASSRISFDSGDVHSCTVTAKWCIAKLEPFPIIIIVHLLMYLVKTVRLPSLLDKWVKLSEVALSVQSSKFDIWNHAIARWFCIPDNFFFFFNFSLIVTLSFVAQHHSMICHFD